MDFVKTNVLDGVLHIELNRPELHNAINLAMVEELLSTFTYAEEQEQIRVILVRGAGEKSFSSGGDLIEFHSISTEEAALKMMNQVAELLNCISSSSKLTVAAINGYALGGGAELTTAFDLRVASTSAQIGFIQSKLGITTAWGGGSRLIATLGKAKALPILITGEKLSAIEWFRLGYIDKLFSETAFMQESFSYVNRLALQSVEIIQAYKDIAKSAFNTEDLLQSISLEIHNAAKLWVSDTHLQAAQRFFEKNNKA